MQIEKHKNFIVEAFEVLRPIITHLNESEKSSYEAKLNSLQKRFYDPEFRLAIVGNFSCGKSTFLNALLKRKLLTTDILPTTAIPTYIRWNKETLLRKTRHDKRKYCNPIITLTMTDGKIYSLTKSGKIDFERETAISLPSDTGAIIDTLTTTNALIGKIRRVELNFLERRGFENLCLIDTPGINPGGEESREHVLQTQKVLREDADAVILLYSAKDAMTRDTEEFMRDNAEHLMAGAIIILTKMDLVPKRQVEKVIKNTARLVKERFKQEEPQVYPISAQQAIDCFSGDSIDPTDLQGANEFNQTLDVIIKQLSYRRSEIVYRRISDLMYELINSIAGSVSTNLTALENERALLKKASSDNLKREFDKLNAEYKNSVLTEINSGMQIISENIHGTIENKRYEIFDKIDNASDLKNLKQILNFYQQNLNEISNEILTQSGNDVSEFLNQSSINYIKNVKACLNKYKRYLGEMDTQISTTKKSGSFQIPFASLSVPEENFFRKHTWKIRAVTFALFGVLGIAVLITGDYIANKFLLKSKKNKAKEEFQNNLRDYESQLIETCRENINQVCEENLKWASDLLEEYRKSYKAMFNEIEQKHNERVTEVETKIISNKKDIKQIEDLREIST